MVLLQKRPDFETPCTRSKMSGEFGHQGVVRHCWFVNELRALRDLLGCNADDLVLTSRWVQAAAQQAKLLTTAQAIDVLSSCAHQVRPRRFHLSGVRPFCLLRAEDNVAPAITKSKSNSRHMVSCCCYLQSDDFSNRATLLRRELATVRLHVVSSIEPTRYRNKCSAC